MNDAADKVFAQAEALWQPERLAFYEAHNSYNRRMNRGTVHAACEDAAAEIATLGSKLLDSVIDAHEIVGRRRNRRWSVETFRTWCDKRISQEASWLRSPAGIYANTPDGPETYIASVDQAERNTKKRIASRLSHYFATRSEYWLWYYAKKFALLKSVPAAWWVALVGWALAIIAVFDPSLAVTLRSMLPHTQ